MKIRSTYSCPLEITHDIIKGKWKPLLLWQLNKGVRSLAELKRELSGISQKVLIEQLKDLEEYQLIAKKSFVGYPLKVEYSITERGREMFQALEIMQKIGNDILKEG